MVAVDGVLADTLRSRAEAVQRAALELGLVHESAPIAPHSMAGRDWAEMVRALPGAPRDESLLDLTALAAERRWSAAFATSAPVLYPEAVARCRTAAESGWQVVLRADSGRRGAAALFASLESATLALRTIAADDPHQAPHQTPHQTPAHDAITRPLLRDRQLLSLATQRLRRTTAPATLVLHAVELVPDGNGPLHLPAAVQFAWGWPPSR